MDEVKAREAAIEAFRLTSMHQRSGDAIPVLSADQLFRINAAIDAYEAALGNREWQPIETAPTKGRYLIAARSGFNDWEVVAVRPRDADRDGNRRWGIEGSEDSFDLYPRWGRTEAPEAYWRDLPELPASQGGK